MQQGFWADEQRVKYREPEVWSDQCNFDMSFCCCSDELWERCLLLSADKTLVGHVRCWQWTPIYSWTTAVKYLMDLLCERKCFGSCCLLEVWSFSNKCFKNAAPTTEQHGTCRRKCVGIIALDAVSSMITTVLFKHVYCAHCRFLLVGKRSVQVLGQAVTDCHRPLSVLHSVARHEVPRFVLSAVCVCMIRQFCRIFRCELMYLEIYLLLMIWIHVCDHCRTYSIRNVCTCH